MSVPVPTTATTLPEGVREGNENLVRLTADASAKVAALIAQNHTMMVGDTRDLFSV